MREEIQELQKIVSVLLEEVISLKNEKQDLEEKVNALSALSQRLLSFCESQQKEIDSKMKNIALSLKIQDKGLDNIVYEMNDPRIDKSSFFYPSFYEIEDTIEMIVNHKCSMARFGDGELAIMAGYSRQKFQAFDSILSQRLREVVSCKEPQFLVAIADNYGSLEKYSRAGKSGIRNYMSNTVRNEHQKLLDRNRVYHNAYISRPYVLFSDCQSTEAGNRFTELKRIWKDREVIIIEGNQTRMGVGNDLLADAQSIIRIECPAENAFERYGEILDAAKENAFEDALFLIALGPVAGVLAYDLFCEGFQAIDIGHLDLEYEWFKRGEGKRTEVPGKYNNEYVGGELVSEVNDTAYLNEIICKID